MAQLIYIYGDQCDHFVKSIGGTSPETCDQICCGDFHRFAAPEIVEALKVNNHAAICQKLGITFVFPIAIFYLLIGVSCVSSVLKVSEGLHQIQKGASVFFFSLYSSPTNRALIFVQIIYAGIMYKMLI